MVRFPCDGPLQDSTGAMFCQVEPWDMEFDCDRCREDYVWFAELAQEVKRDREISVEEDERNSWG